MTEEEKGIFLAKISADKELKEEFIRLKNLAALATSSSTRKEDLLYAEKGWKELNNRISRKKHKQYFISFSRYAAMIVIIIVSTWTIFNRYTLHKENAELTRIEVPVGQKVRLVLSDGTAVWLNSQTKIQYPASFGKEARNVYLDGEVYFEVAHNENKPFVVHTSRGNIKVLGTTFNVFNYSDNTLFETTLLERSVLIEREISREKILLQPNEQAVLKESKLLRRKVETENLMAWRDGILVFENQELGSMIKKLESYYGINFIINEPARIKEKFSAKFLLDDKIEEILVALERTGRVSFSTSMDGKIVYVK
ncbi:MAG: FecR domain-containing protein [Bacteroides sp.]|nr:FecR domain-containing protein [Bacteroides sp.]